ncbi:MAG: zinc-ribbon domain-containing protein [bacterium]|nr:zinc-ribbon domain-containing protein [bacterium]
MKYCSKCGEKMKDDAVFCPSCGEKIASSKGKTSGKKEEPTGFEKLLDTEDTTASFSKKEIESGMVLAILSYIIALVPFLAEKKNKFVIYHAKQGMNLFIIYVIWAIVNSIFPFFPLALIGLAVTILNIIGLIYACQGKAKEVPIINKIKIIK